MHKFNPVQLKVISDALEEYSNAQCMIVSYRDKQKEIVEAVIEKLSKEILSKKDFSLLFRLYEKERTEQNEELEKLEIALEILEKLK